MSHTRPISAIRCHPRTERLLDELDAAVFTGDEFHDADARACFQWFLDRWKRELKEIAESVVDR